MHKLILLIFLLFCLPIDVYSKSDTSFIVLKKSLELFLSPDTSAEVNYLKKGDSIYHFKIDSSDWGKVIDSRGEVLGYSDDEKLKDLHYVYRFPKWLVELRDTLIVFFVIFQSIYLLRRRKIRDRRTKEGYRYEDRSNKSGYRVFLYTVVFSLAFLLILNLVRIVLGFLG